MIEKQPRIALLIDADNSPASKIDVILAELAKVGVTNIRRAYGNWKKDGLKGWEAVLHEYAIRPVQQFDYSKGKNATDMGMIIEAMDLLYTDQPEAFGIVSSDADFTPLVMHLKAKGAQVFGFGAKKTPLPFVNACSRFLYLENLGQPVDRPGEVNLYSERFSAQEMARRNTFTGKTFNSIENISQFFNERGLPVQKPGTPGASPLPRPPLAANPLPGAPPPVRRVARAGMTVEHPKYGTGTVVRREGEGDDAKITVNFPRFGLKKLVEKYAGLKRN